MLALCSPVLPLCPLHAPWGARPEAALLPLPSKSSNSQSQVQGKRHSHPMCSIHGHDDRLGLFIALGERATAGPGHSAGTLKALPHRPPAPGSSLPLI